MKFKVGDILKYKDRDFDDRTFRVTDITSYKYHVIDSDNIPFSPSSVFTENVLELSIKKVKDTELARKFYKDYEIEGEYLVVKITQ